MSATAQSSVDADCAPAHARSAAWSFVRWLLMFLAGVVFLAISIRVYNALAWQWGSHTTRRVFGNGPVPLYAFWMTRPLWPWEALRVAMLPACVAMAWIVLVICLWRWSQRGGKALRWIGPIILPSAVVFSFAINCSTAWMDGGDSRALSRPFERRGLEYFGDVPTVRDRPLEFIQNYPELQRKRRLFGGHLISQHGATHPPGPILLLWATGKCFDRSVWTAAMTAIGLSALAPLATWWLARRVARTDDPSTEEMARRAVRIPLVAVGLHVVSPGLVLFGATCMDGVFVAPIVASAAAIFVAQQARTWRGTIAAAIGAGALVSLSLMLTFGTVCLGVFFGIDFLLNFRRRGWQRRATALATTAATVCAIHGLLWMTLRYDVLATLASAMARNDVAVGTGYESWARYFDLSIAHLVAFIITTGVAATWLSWSGAAAGMVRAVRGGLDRESAYSLAITATIVLLAFSTLFTLEVERVWMWLIPFALIAAVVPLVRRFDDAPMRFAAGALAIVLSLQFAQTWLMQRYLYMFW